MYGWLVNGGCGFSRREFRCIFSNCFNMGEKMKLKVSLPSTRLEGEGAWVVVIECTVYIISLLHTCVWIVKSLSNVDVTIVFIERYNVIK